MESDRFEGEPGPPRRYLGWISLAASSVAFPLAATAVHLRGEMRWGSSVVLDWLLGAGAPHVGTGYTYAGNPGVFRIVSVRYLGTDPKLQQRVVKMERIEGRPDTIKERQARYESRGDYRGDARYAQRDERRDVERREYREERRNTGAIDLYGQPEFRGRSVRIENNVDDLAERRFDGRASSVVVHEGTWQLCSEPGFRGQCATLRPGEYAQLAGLDDRVSSLRQLR